MKMFCLVNCKFSTTKKFIFLMIILLYFFCQSSYFSNLFQKNEVFKYNLKKLNFKNLTLKGNINGGISLETNFHHIPSSFHLLLGFFTSASSSEHFVPTISKNQDRLDLTYNGILKLTLKHLKMDSYLETPSPSECYNIHWSSLENRINLFRDFIYLGDSYWYGGASMLNSFWPINTRQSDLAPFVTGDSFKKNYGSIQERFWMSSSGISIFVDYNAPLFVDINGLKKNYLVFESHYSKPYSNSKKQHLTLNYTLCFSYSPKQSFSTAAKNFWKIPSSIPNPRLFHTPSWSTWAMFKRGINTEVLVSYAQNILELGFNGSHLVIDDGWMSHYGDFQFLSSSFPHPQKLTKYLKQQNFTISLWLHPFSAMTSSSFWKTDQDGFSYWVHYVFKWLPSLLLWWNGIGAALDLTNEQTIEWYVAELKQVLEHYNIDAFKFDAGEASWLPHFRSFKQPLDNPNDYTQSLNYIAQQLDTGSHMQEVRSSVSYQQLPAFVRLIDKKSEWSDENGLSSIIPQALTVGLIGYPFVLPDMIGGNAYYGILIHFTTLPDKELYIRWIQTSALMPAMQFSIGPWSYDPEVVQIASNMVKLHQFFSSYIISLAHQATKDGSPIMRPVWWNEKEGFYGGDMVVDDWGKSKVNAKMDDDWMTDEGIVHKRKMLEALYQSESEFLLGDEVLVAPILREHSEQRWVLFPAGVWVRGVMKEGRWNYGHVFDTKEKTNNHKSNDTKNDKVSEAIRRTFHSDVYRGSYDASSIYYAYNSYLINVPLSELAYFIKISDGF